MTVSTIYPSYSVQAGASETGTNWATKRAENGIDSLTTGNPGTIYAFWGYGIDTNSSWDRAFRGILKFDTTSVPDWDECQAATFNFVATTKTEDWTESMCLVGGYVNEWSGDPADNTFYNNRCLVGGVSQSEFILGEMTVASITANDSTYNTITLNSSGRRHLDFKNSFGAGQPASSRTTTLSWQLKSDVMNTEPSVSDNELVRVDIRTQEHTGTSKDPYLSITHINPLINQANVSSTGGSGNNYQTIGTQTSYDDIAQTFTLDEETDITGFGIYLDFDSYGMGTNLGNVWSCKLTGVEETGVYTGNRAIPDESDTKATIDQKFSHFHLYGAGTWNDTTKIYRIMFTNSVTLAAGMYAICWISNHTSGTAEHWKSWRFQHPSQYAGGRNNWRPNGDPWHAATDSGNSDTTFAIYGEVSASPRSSAVIIT